MITYSVVKKHYLFVILLLIFQLLSFGFDGMRVNVIITVFSFLFPIFYEKYFKQRNLLIFIVFGLTLLASLSILEHILIGSGEIDRLIFFRTFFLPNLISSWFSNFFSSNIPDYFRSSFLRYLGLTSPYTPLGIDFIISGLYSGNFEGRANNGLLADALTNLGHIGMIIFPFLIQLWFRLLDKISVYLNKYIVLTTAVYFSYMLTNNFLLIVLFTNGGIIVTIMFYILNNFQINKVKKKILKETLEN
jgi:hypothetical protein